MLISFKSEKFEEWHQMGSQLPWRYFDVTHRRRSNDFHDSTFINYFELDIW